MWRSWPSFVSLFCPWSCRHKAVPHFQMQSWTTALKCSQILCGWEWGPLIWVVGPSLPESLAVSKTCLSLLLSPFLVGQFGHSHNSEGAGVLWALNVMVKHTNNIKLFRGKQICGWDLAAARQRFRCVPGCLRFVLPLPNMRSFEEKSSALSPTRYGHFHLSENGKFCV